MSKKQSSVEWFAEMVSKMGYVSVEILEQAKAMHKEEIKYAWNDGAYGGGQFTTTFDNEEQYYKQTYGGSK
jgi:hypothetical protein